MSYSDENGQAISREDWITDRLLITYAAMDKAPPTAIAVATMASDLAQRLTDEQLIHALSRLRTEREWISTKAIIELSDVNKDSRPEVETAWSLCPKTEEQSALWTEEMSQAFGACRELLMDGDKIGARMAFKERYTSLVSEARLLKRPVKWSVSLGWDMSDRVRVLSEGIRQNLISQQFAYSLIPPEQQEQIALLLPAGEHKMLSGKVEHSGLGGLFLQLAQNKAIPSDWVPEPKDVYEPMTPEQLREKKQRMKQELEQMGKNR